MTWNASCFELLNWSQQYHQDHKANDENIQHQWTRLVTEAHNTWQKITMGTSIVFELSSVEEQQEEDILQQEEHINDTHLE
jgi:hypothetical protein